MPRVVLDVINDKSLVSIQPESALRPWHSEVSSCWTLLSCCCFFIYSVVEMSAFISCQSIFLTAILFQDDDNLQISWSHTYAKVHHRKAKTLTALECVDTALLVAKQLGKNHIGPELNVVLLTLV